MAKLVCVHEVELTKQEDAAEFERLFTEGLGQPTLPGWKIQLLKGDRGERGDKYAYLVEIEGVEARDRFFPEDGPESEEFDNWKAEHPGAAEILERAHALQAGAAVTTDYLVVA